MNAFIMIVMFNINLPGQHLEMQEFNNLPACYNAAKTIASTFKKDVTIFCKEKGNNATSITE